MRKEIPAGVLEMLAVPGLRPDKVLRLYNALGITSLAELEQAAREDRIKTRRDLGVRCRQRFSEASQSPAVAKAVSTYTARQVFSKTQNEACNRRIRS